MAVTEADIRFVPLTDEEIARCISVAQKLTPHIRDRSDLHARDYLERFVNVTLGEIAEAMTLKFFRQSGKYAASAVDKASAEPDLGHDVALRTADGREILGSVKSSLSVFKTPAAIVETFTLATKRSELRDVNIQVYFWLDIFSKGTSEKNRVNLPNAKNAALIGWAGRRDLQAFAVYEGEAREAPELKLKDMRPMAELLELVR